MDDFSEMEANSMMFEDEKRSRPIVRIEDGLEVTDSSLRVEATTWGVEKLRDEAEWGLAGQLRRSHETRWPKTFLVRARASCLRFVFSNNFLLRSIRGSSSFCSSLSYHACLRVLRARARSSFRGRR